LKWALSLRRRTQRDTPRSARVDRALSAHVAGLVCSSVGSQLSARVAGLARSFVGSQA